jgi:hypothetical protein
MKLKLTSIIALGTLLATTAVTVSPALAKGKPPKTGANCRPQITLILSGTVAGAPSGSNFQMAVTRANHHARGLVTATQLTIKTNSSTKIVRNGTQTTLSTLQANDRVQVQFRFCKGDLSGLNAASFNNNASLYAKRVTAHAPTAENENENGS